MNLVASLICRNELHRYLEPCIRHLQEFCDEIRVWDDGSDDGTREWLEVQERVAVDGTVGARFFQHEGNARNALLAWTLQARPTHVLTLDADEFVTDGPAVRAALERAPGRSLAWMLPMEEVWKADARGLSIRQDGGWRAHPVTAVWRVPPGRSVERPHYRIANRALACGREPIIVRRQRGEALPGSILHMGWTCQAERQVRYDRYATHDGGRFHASAHLRSILAGDGEVRLTRRPWPAGLDKKAILARVRREPVAA